MFHVFGEIIPCWWNPTNHEYRLVTPAQQRDYKLDPLTRITRGIARVSKMKKFTSEICLNEDGQFFAVDYLNAQPDMNPKSHYPNGVPDEVVRHIVWLLVREVMHLVKRRHGYLHENLKESDGDWVGWRRLEQQAPTP